MLLWEHRQCRSWVAVPALRCTQLALWCWPVSRAFQRRGDSPSCSVGAACILELEAEPSRAGSSVSQETPWWYSSSVAGHLPLQS